MPAVIIDRESEAHLKQTPERLTARFAADIEIIPEVIGVPLSKLPTLWPYNHFAQIAAEAARRFIDDMARHDAQHTLVSEIYVWAPLEPRTYRMAEPLKANHRRAVGYQGSELMERLGKADMLLAGLFIPKYVRMIEHVHVPARVQMEEA